MYIGSILILPYKSEYLWTKITFLQILVKFQVFKKKVWIIFSFKFQSDTFSYLINRKTLTQGQICRFFFSFISLKNSGQGENWFEYRYKQTCPLIRHLRVVPHKCCEYFCCSWCILVRFLVSHSRSVYYSAPRRAMMHLSVIAFHNISLGFSRVFLADFRQSQQLFWQEFQSEFSDAICLW